MNENTVPEWRERLAQQSELAEVVGRWRTLKSSKAEGTLKEYVDCGNSLLFAGAALLAQDVAKSGLRRFPKDVQLQLIMGRALARSHATLEAYELARNLYEEMTEKGKSNATAASDIEIIGLLARVLKDMYLQSDDPKLKAECLSQAAGYYEEAFQTSVASGGAKRYWPAINAATLAVAGGQHAKAHELTNDVLGQCETLLHEYADENEERFWILATLGEAKLILRETAASIHWYHEAAELAFKKRLLGPLCSMARNMRILLDSLEIHDDERAKILSSVRPPKVVMFTGHMIDRQDRKFPRFPAHLEDKVEQAIENKLKEYGPVIGFASAACGSDILFLESILGKCRGEAYVVLPYDRKAFAEDSVDAVGGDWHQRYENVLSDATEVITVSPHQKSKWGSISYEYSNLILTGLSMLAARHLECEVMCLSVWDESPGDGPGGTASIVRRWREYGLQVDVINPKHLNDSQPPEESPRERIGLGAARESSSNHRSSQYDRMVIKSLLFADVKGFSKLSEEQMPSFIDHFYGLLARVIRRSADKPIITEDRGDGVYCVFESAAKAGRFALELNECISQVDWEKQVGRELQIRIGLHSGPVHEFLNPISGALGYTGTHVSRAARIEPVAPPGHVYASREFAAIATLEGLELKKHGEQLHFTCAYVGQTEWHKDYGLEPTFHVRRKLS